MIHVAVNVNTTYRQHYTLVYVLYMKLEWLTAAENNLLLTLNAQNVVGTTNDNFND